MFYFITNYFSSKKGYSVRNSLKVFCMVCTCLGLMACEKGPSAMPSEEPVQIRKDDQQNDGKMLAYEHRIQVEVPADQLLTVYNSTFTQCQNSSDYSCDVTSAVYSSKKYGKTQLNIRVESYGVNDLLNHVKQKGHVTAQSTSIDDLTKPIVDVEKRIQMLTEYRDKLLEIQIEAANDVDSLVKVARELSTVQNNLEQVKGSADKLMLRIDRDLLIIQFNKETNTSVWDAFGETFSELPESFTMGLTDTLEESMYLLPWLIIIILLFVLFRWLWHKTQPKNKKSR